MEKQNCKARWAAHKNSTISDLRLLWWAYQNEDTKRAEKIRDDLGDFHEYGLCFDYVAPGTFRGQKEGYWRYQISYGGPSEEFRFYASSPDAPAYRITFVFLDWFDGYERKLSGRDESLLDEIWSFFQEIGSAEAEYEKAVNE